VIEAEVVVRHAIQEFAFGHPQQFGKILQRLAGRGENHRHMLALKALKHLPLLRVAGIVADDDLELRAGPGTGLRNPCDGQQIVPVRGEQDRKPHGPRCRLMRDQAPQIHAGRPGRR
jgi:hypothetical protein